MVLSFFNKIFSLSAQKYFHSFILLPIFYSCLYASVGIIHVNGTYNMTEDHEGTVIFDNSHSTLNMNGFTIDATGYSYGIYIGDKTNDTINGGNGTVENGEYGIYIDNDQNNGYHKIQQLEVNSAIYYGIINISSNYNLIYQVNVNNCDYTGIFLYDSEHNTVSGCNIFENGIYGLSDQLGYLNSFQYLQIYDNEVHGIYISADSLYSMLNVNSYSNSSVGLYIAATSYGGLVSSYFNENQYGVVIDEYSDNNNFSIGASICGGRDNTGGYDMYDVGSYNTWSPQTFPNHN